MLIIKIIFTTSVLSLVSLHELTPEEKIKIHKDWLAKRAALKALQQQNSSTSEKLLLNQKVTKIENLLEENRNLSLHENYTLHKEKSNQAIKIPIITNVTTTTATTTITDKNVVVSTTVKPEESKIDFTQNITRNLNLDSDKHINNVLPSSPSSPSSSSSSSSKSSMKESINRTFAGPSIIDPRRKFHKSEGKLKSYPRWTVWSKWSECSRSCDGGIMFQDRKCVSKLNSGKRVLSKECIGNYKRFQICNQQRCPSAVKDFRSQQCSSFNNILFQGKKYTWEPYIKEDGECELNCKPIGMRYFATLNQTVIDGTTCFRPSEYYRRNYRGPAMCIEGICKAISPNGIISGTFTNNGILPCASLLCKAVSKIYTKEHLSHGYYHVTTLPSGASNISIIELKNSNNLLVLKTANGEYVFNGNYTYSNSGGYKAAGTIFDYRRVDDSGKGDNRKKIEGVTEWITAAGPIIEPVNLMVLNRDTNPGIKYEYLLPIPSDLESEEELWDDTSYDEEYTSYESDEKINLKSADYGGGGGGGGGTGSTSGNFGTSERPIIRRRSKFQWKLVGFSTCSKSCGGGTQIPVIRCVRQKSSRFFSPRRCTHSEKPVINDNLLRCNTQPCPAYWHLEEWSNCRCQPDGVGYREREVHCVQEVSTGVVINVGKSACEEEEPFSKTQCDCPKPTTPASRRRQRTQMHARAPQPLTMNNVTQRTSHRSDKAGVWLISDWNQKCSVECGIGVEHRSIFCEHSKKNGDRCDMRQMPDTTKPCENDRLCDDADWFTSQWGQCRGSCFNLTKTRQVICLHNRFVVEDSECSIKEKPTNIQNCSRDEVDYCKPKWHYSVWSECSRSCGGGTQRRIAKCLEIDPKENILRESSKCRYSERENIYRSCNVKECQDTHADIVQNDISPDCMDKFINCDVIVKARLCSYDYYKINCCESCLDQLPISSHNK